jgi:HAD superfamily hydrolase (TIGR01490 family)
MNANEGMPSPGKGIALFDLDYTLLGGDATYEWIHFLIRLGILEREVHGVQLDQFYDDYAKGTLDIVDFLHFDLEPLARHPRSQLEAWREEYLAQSVAPMILPRARELIASHATRGHETVIVTAANSFITTPIAAMLGVADILASDPETHESGEFTGRIAGIPCFHEGKVKRLDAWLGERGETLADFTESWFYGDSQSDVPLMEKVTNAVAVGPDERLGRIARERGWPIISLR